MNFSVRWWLETSVSTHTCMDTALCAYGQLALRTGTGLRERQTKVPPLQRLGRTAPSPSHPHSRQTILWLPANPIPDTMA